MVLFRYLQPITKDRLPVCEVLYYRTNKGGIIKYRPYNWYNQDIWAKIGKYACMMME